MALDEISKGSVKSGHPPPSAEGGGGPDFTLGMERMTKEWQDDSGMTRMAQDEISKGSVKSGPPPPSAEGGGGPDFSLRR